MAKITIEDVQLTGDNKSYINRSLYPFYRMLLSENKPLHRMGKIFANYVSNGKVKIKIQENNRPLITSHKSDLESHFSYVELNPPRYIYKVMVTC